MIKLIDIDSTKGHLLLSVLSDNGIRAHLRDEYSNAVVPSVWLENEDDYDNALKYIDQILNKSSQQGNKNKIVTAWICIAISILAIIFFLLIKLH